MIRFGTAGTTGAPSGYELCNDFEPIVIRLDNNTVTLKGSDIAAKAGLPADPPGKSLLPGPGELAGVMLLANARIGTMVEGRSYPSSRQITSGRTACIYMTAHDRLCLHSYRRCSVALIPYTRSKEQPT